MTDEEIATIGRVADMCRAKGIKLLDIPNNIKMELDPTPAKDTPGPTTDPDMCSCGHPEYAHTNGLCVTGCDPDKCNPPARFNDAGKD